MCGLAGGLLLLAGAAHAQVLVEDGFGDADRDNDAITDGALVTDALDVGVPWYLGRGTSDVIVGTADDTAGIGSDNAIDILSMTTSTRGLLGSFTPVTLADGDIIAFSFDVRITESPIDATDGGTFPTADLDRRFRFGLYNSNGTFVTGDTGDTSITGNDTGYVASIDIGSGAGSTYAAVGDQADGILGGSAVSMSATSTDTQFFLDNTPRRLAMVMSRSGDEMDVVILFDGIEAQDGTATAADIATFSLPYGFDYVAFGMSGASLDYRVDNIVVQYISGSDPTPLFDGFEDGDRDNNGVPEGPVNDPGDVGYRWFRSTGTSSFDVTVADDSAGIGTGNALIRDTTTTSTRAVSARFDDITLAEIGDQISFSFDMRPIGTIPTSDRRFRWGIHNDGGTPVTADGSGEAADDSGYIVQQDTGVASGDASTIRGIIMQSSPISGSTRSTSASTSDPSTAVTSNATRRYEMRVRRSFDATLMRDVNIITFLIDGIEADQGVDDGDGVVTDPVTYTFNQMTIGTNSLSDFEFAIDNVSVFFIPATPAGNVNSDGFEDGDRDNNGSLEGPVNDPFDTGYTWYRSRGGSSAPTIQIIDDSGAGNIDSLNAFNVFTLSSSTRSMSAAIQEITLETGDKVSMAFDIRLRGPIPADDAAGFRFGIHDSAGTPITQDGGPTLTNDDLGYIGLFDTGASADSTASIRGDNDPLSFMGGKSRALGGTSDDPAFALDDNMPHRIELEVMAALDTQGERINLVTLYFDNVIATSGVDDGQEAGDPDRPEDPDAVTFTFNQITFGTQVDFIDYNIDNVVVTFTPAPTCAPDLDLDGELTFFDIALFQNLFDAMDPVGDWNNDTFFTDQDVTDYLTDFNAGCP
ncbi:MAG: hypothetical protein AAFX05_00035 [Planctomycetota bacterium]